MFFLSRDLIFTELGKNKLHLEENMKILFIGGTGRLSKDVAFKALMDGHEVFLLTRGSNKREQFVHDGYIMLRGDIRNPDACRKLLENLSFDTVIDFLSFTVRQLETTLFILNGKYKQYIFISTATVYENEKPLKEIEEEITPIGNKQWDYSYNKFLCEKYLEDYFQKNHFSYYTIIRPYVTYGNTRFPYPIVPLDNDKEWSLIFRMTNGCPIPVFDCGEIITTLTHTKDFSKFAVGLIGNEKAKNEAFHITSDERTTWETVLNILDAHLNIRSKRFDISQQEIVSLLPYYKGILEGDKGNTKIFNNAKIKNAVKNERFNIKLEDGLYETLMFYQNHPERQIIDYQWLGEMDKLCDVKKIKTKHIHFPSKTDKKLYNIGRYGSTSKLIFCLHRIKRFLHNKEGI